MSRIPFNQQIRNFESTLDQISNNLGAVNVGQSIARCIFFVGMGSNDYLNNYLMPNYATRNQYNAQQYADLLVNQYTQQLTVSTPFTASLLALNSIISIFMSMSCCAEAVQSGGQKVCDRRVGIDGVHSKHFGAERSGELFRRSEPTCSTFQCQREEHDKPAEYQPSRSKIYIH